MNKSTITKIIIILLGVSLLIYFIVTNARKVFYKNCSEIVPLTIFAPLSVGGCYNFISVKTDPIVDYYRVYDHLHAYEIGQVMDPKKIIYINNKIYFKSTQKEDDLDWFTDNDEKKGYFKKFYKGGKVVDGQYYGFNDIPVYFIVDTETGEVQTYFTKDEIPSSEREFFKD